MESTDFNDLLEGAFGTVMAIIMIIFMVMLAVYILYLVSLKKALMAVSPELRTTHPDNVFLMLIPLFNLVYYFFIVKHIGDSLGAEMRKRGMAMTHPRPTYQIGLATAILYCVSLIPVLGGLASFGGFVCWIIHWVQVAEVKGKILSNGATDVLDQGLNP